ncbi:hypothetical protein KSC_073450 [Ktedonobacter sp. SOSP1-52]|nr:hypothetical protein KSC_073450 [Ktedonobacter sp. SOSP1-52]
MPVAIRPEVVDLLIVDEVDGLLWESLEVLRDLSDRSRLGLVLLGRPRSAERLVKLSAFVLSGGCVARICSPWETGYPYPPRTAGAAVGFAS